MKKIASILLFLFVFALNLPQISPAMAENDTNKESYNELNYALDEENGGGIVYNFLVFDEEGNLIFERSNVELGDIIITKDFNKYEIVDIDITTKIAKAKFVEKIKKPQIVKKQNGPKTNDVVDKKIGLYMTHNDESFVIGDGVSSINGAGGIHDIAKTISTEMSKLGIKTTLDETIHNPHNSLAYSRSEKTAKKLKNMGVDALFDIHRDGVARSVYVKNIDGVDRCKVRIVVGQANPNKDINLEFATYLFAVAEEYCPWLFLDIYLAKGHYNQSLSPKSLLFEMGTYLAEKDLVKNTVPYLVSVINTTLYSATVEDTNSAPNDDKNEVIDSGNIENGGSNITPDINNNVDSKTPIDKIVIDNNIAQENTISNILDSKVESGGKVDILRLILRIVLFLNVTVGILFVLYYFYIRRKEEKQKRREK